MPNQSKTDDKELFLNLLANKHSIAILSLTSIRDYSASQLSQELDIPLATVYRKLKLLESIGIIQNNKIIINPSGNEEKYYRCAIHEFLISFKNGEISIDKLKFN